MKGKEGIHFIYLKKEKYNKNRSLRNQSSEYKSPM